MMTPKHRILFQSDPHSYIDPKTGREIDSLTSIIKRHGHGYEGPPGFAGRGQFVHDCLEIIAAGADVEDSSVPPEWLGYVQAIRRFFREQRPKVHFCEVPLYHPFHAYAGTPDLWCSLPNLGSFMAIVDAKSGDHRGCDLQLGGQVQLIRENFTISPSGVYRLQINRDESYQIAPCDMMQCEQDWLALLRLEMRRRRTDGSNA